MQNTLGYDSTPHKRPSHWTNILGGIEKKCSGENILGLGGSTPRIGLTYSGGMTGPHRMRRELWRSVCATTIYAHEHLF